MRQLPILGGPGDSAFPSFHSGEALESSLHKADRASACRVFAVPERRVEGRQSMTFVCEASRIAGIKSCRSMQRDGVQHISLLVQGGVEWCGEDRASLGLADPFTATSSTHGQRVQGPGCSTASCLISCI